MVQSSGQLEYQPSSTQPLPFRESSSWRTCLLRFRTLPTLQIFESLQTDYYRTLLELLHYQNSIQNWLELRTVQLLLRMTYVLLRLETFGSDPVDPPPSHLYTLPQGGQEPGKSNAKSNLDECMRCVTTKTSISSKALDTLFLGERSTTLRDSAT